ncbi:UNVERIFIED_CONTAM: hypothetical protein GTU68_061207 [Idotea baltica]|nr:hypothetical protein [Idotea baltica]
MMELAEKAISLLKALIETPSISREEGKTAELIEKFLRAEGVKTERIGNNIWARNKHYDLTLPTILLNSHHDTVKPNAGYTKDPFSAIVEDGKLYGLGSNDAGGCLVSLIATFLHFYNAENLNYNLILAASAEEEISGKGGIERLLPQLPDIDFAIVGEPTQMLDVRTTDAYSNEETLAIIREHVDCDVTPRSTRLNPSGIGADHPIVKAGKAQGRNTYGSPTLSDQALMPFASVKLGPGDSARSHTADEYVFIKEIEDGVDIYAAILGKLLVDIPINQEPFNQ